MKRQHLCIVLALFILCAFMRPYTADHVHKYKDNVKNSNLCFEEFLERSSNTTQDYIDRIDDCQNQRTRRRLHFTREKDMEREQIENGTAILCDNFESCKKYEAHEDFFKCHIDNNYDNIDMLITIHLNASVVAVELSLEYEEAEKEVMLCSIEAERTYSKESRESLRELQICLKVL